MKLNLTEREVFDTYGIPVRQLRSLRAHRIGPRFIKISGQLGEKGGRILYPTKSVESWIASRPAGGELGERHLEVLA